MIARGDRSSRDRIGEDPYEEIYKAELAKLQVRAAPEPDPTKDKVPGRRRLMIPR